jgi:hypothetical protein
LVLLVTGLITAASLWQASQQDLAVESDRMHLELIEKLVSMDVAQASADERLQLTRRLDRAFRLGADWQEPILELDEPAWTRFRENLFALLHDWLIDRANEYHELSQNGRRAQRLQHRFVDRQVDTVTAWISAAPEASAEQSRGLRSRFAPLELIGRVQQWTNEADGDERARLEAFTTALVARAIERQRETLSVPGA